MTDAEARRYLLHATGLSAPVATPGALLEQLGCIQLDPIDRYGTSAELVAWARLPQPADLYGSLANRSFEHFAKERCILSPRFFPWYQGKAVQTPWWRHDERLGHLADTLLDEVRAEVAEKGPVRPDQLESRGTVEAMDWAGWKGTGKRTTLALETLWTQCRVVVAARDSHGRRLYDVPERALPAEAFARVTGDFGEEMVVERVRSAGLLCTAGGAHWSMLKDHRSDGTVERLEKQGRIRRVTLGRRSYLALLETAKSLPELPDQELRVLAPLDPLLWDRKLVEHLFGFDYVWEIYKPEAQRRWGYYVCPLLRGERLVGRIEARRAGKTLQLLGLWWEDRATAGDKAELEGCLERLARANGCTEVVRGP